MEGRWSKRWGGEAEGRDVGRNGFTMAVIIFQDEEQQLNVGRPIWILMRFFGALQISKTTKKEIWFFFSMLRGVEG